jgi:hypothetical protein
MSLDYAYEKFWSAVVGMAQSKKKLRERIEDAYVYNIIHVQEADVPQTYRNDFRRLKEMVTYRAPRHPGEGAVRATTQQMSYQKVDEAARLITHLFDGICAAKHEEDDQMARREVMR